MDVVLDNLDLLWAGFWMTCQITFLSFAGALVIGTVLTTMRVSPVAPLRGAGLAYVELFRNMPLVVLLTLLYFGIPKLGVGFTPLTAAVTGVAIYHAAYICEALRSGVNAVAAGQAEAARSIGLTFAQSMRLVILPQAFRTVVAPIGSIFIALTKNTAVAISISAFDLAQRAGGLIAEEARAVTFLLAAAVFYMLVTVSASVVFGAVERRVAIKR